MLEREKSRKLGKSELGNVSTHTVLPLDDRDFSHDKTPIFPLGIFNRPESACLGLHHIDPHQHPHWLVGGKALEEAQLGIESQLIADFTRDRQFVDLDRALTVKMYVNILGFSYCTSESYNYFWWSMSCCKIKFYRL